MIDKKNHDLLSLFIAGIAVLLSQFQPIYKYFEDYEIELQKLDKIQLVPHPYAGISVITRPIIGNSGAEKGVIHNIHLIISEESSNELYIYKSSDIKIPKVGSMMFNEWLEFSPQTINTGNIWSKNLRFTKTNVSNSFIQLVNNVQIKLEEDNNEWCEDNYPACEQMNGMMYIPPKELTGKFYKGVIKEHSWIKPGKKKLTVIYETGTVKPEQTICEEYTFNINKFNTRTLLTEIRLAMDSSAGMTFDTKRAPIKVNKTSDCSIKNLKNYKKIIS